jgi:hypothetical protein
VDIYYGCCVNCVERVVCCVFDVLASGCNAILNKLLSCIGVGLMVAGGGHDFLRF